ncbi:MAG TPA: hypothetical protein VFV97_05500, partial [Rhodanobacteraceae bacterium]|nr:hypothetical protein [Rhodanobacteraceae bacterium]
MKTVERPAWSGSGTPSSAVPIGPVRPDPACVQRAAVAFASAAAECRPSTYEASAAMSASP